MNKRRRFKAKRRRAERRWMANYGLTDLSAWVESADAALFFDALVTSCLNAPAWLGVDSGAVGDTHA
jgi:hypothetical protein